MTKHLLLQKPCTPPLPQGEKLQRIRRYKVFIEGVEQPIFCTQREMEIVLYLQKGLAYAEISQHLGISPRTIESHVRRLRIKLGCKNRYVLVEKEITFAEIPRAADELSL